MGSSQIHQLVLNSAPSFSIYNDADGFQDLGAEGLVRSVTIGNSMDSVGDGDFTFTERSMGLIEEERDEDDEKGAEREVLEGIQKVGIEDGAEPASPPMYLASGLGIEASGFGFGNNGVHVIAGSVEEGEEFYREKLEEFPCHPLLLRNYAQLLQAKGDISGAEEYFFRATLADPGDGEILVCYAKLVWELYGDHQKASTYFERAVEAAPHDSYVLGAYAKFLWEVEDDEEDGAQEDRFQIQQEKGQNELVRASVTTEGDNANEYRMKMDGDHHTSHLLRDYTEALHQQLEGDVLRTDECYLQTMLAHPGDGEIMTQYAKMAWEVQHDHTKASSLFEQAVEASPQDSNVLAAYASFLWETEDESAEEHDTIQVPLNYAISSSVNA